MEVSIDARFEELRNFLKIKNWVDFATKFDTTDTKIYSYRLKGVKLPDDFKEKLLESNINPDWLSKGIGKMEISNMVNYSNLENSNDTLIASEDITPYSVKVHEPIPLIGGDIDSPAEFKKLQEIRKIANNNTLSYRHIKILLLNILNGDL